MVVVLWFISEFQVRSMSVFCACQDQCDGAYGQQAEDGGPLIREVEQLQFGMSEERALQHERSHPSDHNHHDEARGVSGKLCQQRLEERYQQRVDRW